MKARGKIPVELIIPDAGPLISLAHADQLDLVYVFGQRIAIADVVKAECLKKPSSPDYQVLKNWFERNANSIQIIETPIASVFEHALTQEQLGLDRSATRGLGDATVTWVLQNLDRVTDPGVVPLVLTEDRTFSLDLASGQKAHVLSTRSWLAGLEEAGAIASAAELLQAMGQHGRAISNLNIDRPVTRNEVASDWIENVSPSVTINRIRDLLVQPLAPAEALRRDFNAVSAHTKSVARSVFINAKRHDVMANTIALIALAPHNDRTFVAQIAILGKADPSAVGQYDPVIEDLNENSLQLLADEGTSSFLKRHGATVEYTDELDRQIAAHKSPEK